MMSSLNQVALIGHLGRDPEIRSFQTGGKVANLSLATTEKWKDKNTGQMQERTEWHRIAIFASGLVDVVDRYAKKGDKIYIQGRLETRKWQDQSGADRYATEVVLRPYDSKLVLLGSGAGSGGAAGQGGGSGQGQGQGGGGAPRQDLDDEIPF
ncbi:single-stranded DNA-binding protein [Yoonia sp.]|uniref:single-stranded DNA-binding protein n=1 Tax=Yoonia sp. TaxID=2212373 RepID=UPI0025FF158E|nr:single-stranded DNA-binding protein [Yoonia sp.]